MLSDIVRPIAQRCQLNKPFILPWHDTCYEGLFTSCHLLFYFFPYHTITHWRTRCPSSTGNLPVSLNDNFNHLYNCAPDSPIGLPQLPRKYSTSNTILTVRAYKLIPKPTTTHPFHATGSDEAVLVEKSAQLFNVLVRTSNSYLHASVTKP